MRSTEKDQGRHRQERSAEAADGRWDFKIECKKCKSRDRLVYITGEDGDLYCSQCRPDLLEVEED